MAILSVTKNWVRTTSKLVLGVIAVLIIARLVLPYAVESYVNRTLDRIPEYDGRVGDVDISLFRGAYTIKDIKIVKTTGKVPEPFFSAAAVDLSVEWKALFEGKWVGEIVVDYGQLNFVKGPSDKNSQTEINKDWLNIIKDLFPLRLNRLELNHSEISYHDHFSKPPVNILLSHVDVVGRNFSNTRSANEGLVASIEGSGLLKEKAKIKLKTTLEPSSKLPTFKAETSMESLPVQTLNDFLMAYGNVDAEGGTISVFSELEVKNGKLRGYVKPLVKDLKLLGHEKQGHSVFGDVWEVLVATTAEIFENQKRGQIATKIELEGSLDNPQTNTLDTIWGIIQNAFIKAFKPGWEKAL